MLAASCALEHHQAHPEHVQSLSLAKHMLAQARAADAALAQLPKTGSAAGQAWQSAQSQSDNTFQQMMLRLASTPVMSMSCFVCQPPQPYL